VGQLHVQDLPAVIPLFPLPNVVLFPHLLLPLHIFEPRYRAMTQDALDGSQLIGMVLLRPGWEDAYRGRPAVHLIGTAGQIRESDALDDGCFNIVLAGLREFEVSAEHGDRAYRYATVAWREMESRFVLPASDRARLESLVSAYLEQRGRAELKPRIFGRDVGDDVLVNSICQGMGFSPAERLWLLESSSLAERGQRLVEVLDFAILERRAPAGSNPGRRLMH
jgi:Lon protease-like protein